MKTEYYLNADQVPAIFKGSYTGKKYRVVITGNVVIPSHAGLWDGGSRTTYTVMGANGASMQGSDNFSAPWDKERQDRHVKIGDGVFVISHSIFCGKDMGLTIYAAPEDIAPYLPKEEEELSYHERLVLVGTRSYKASYNGQNRMQMVQRDARYIDGVEPITDEQWESAKQSLIEKKLLNRAGAITTAGKNAIGGISTSVSSVYKEIL